jgi:hypothetical protein
VSEIRVPNADQLAPCPAGSFNSGIRGLAPGVDLEDALESVLHEARQRLGAPVRLSRANARGERVFAILASFIGVRNAVGLL